MHDRDLPLSDAGVHWGVRSPHDCGELAIRHDKNVAVYRPEHMGCWLKDIHWKSGVMYTSQGYFIGTYDIRGLDREDTWDSNRVDWWKSNNYCDIIHHGHDGRYWCKSYPYSHNTILMFRYNS